MSGYSLLAPLWLLALPLVGLLPWWIGRHRWHAPRVLAPLAVRHPGAATVRRTSRPTGTDRTHWIGLPILLFLVIALAEPVRYGASLPAKPAPVDLVVVMDVSVSMSHRDYQLDGERVDRLTMAKRLVDGFARSFSGRRMGLVVLGAPPAVWVPLTEDRDLVHHLLARLELTMAGRNAALGDALALTAERFGGEGERVAVLLSAASLPLGRLSPEEGAERLRDSGITLYTIGIGATDRSAAEERGTGLIYEPADLELLARIATTTGGEAFHAVDARAIRQALDAIESRHRGAQSSAESPRTRQPLYQWPLGVALLLLASLPWLADRRARGWTGAAPLP